MEYKNKVNWLRETNLANGITLSVSDTTGIVKMQLPASGRRSPVLYVDEILLIVQSAIDIQRFLEKNDDVCFTSGQAKESSAIKRGQERALRQATQALSALSPEMVEKILAMKKQA